MDPTDRAILDYAAKLTLTPAAMEDANIQLLHDAGLSDTVMEFIDGAGRPQHMIQ